MIEVQNLTYEYSSIRALDNISFSVPRDRITALIGSNGSGKTTLLECLAGIKRPINGTVFINGIDMLKSPRECHKYIGFLSGYTGLYDNLTVKQNLTYFAIAYRIPENQIKIKVSEIIKKLGLEDKTNEKTSRLSRGTRQRLAIGQIIMHKPKLLILNKPTAGLDTETRKFFLAFLKNLNKQEGMTIFVAFQILSELKEFADNIILLKDGIIVDNNLIDSPPYKKLKISLRKVPDNINDLIIKLPNISYYHLSGNEIELYFTGNEEEQIRLLKYLMEKNIGVKNFYEKDIDIEEQYLAL